MNPGRPAASSVAEALDRHLGAQHHRGWPAGLEWVRLAFGAIPSRPGSPASLRDNADVTVLLDVLGFEPEPLAQLAEGVIREIEVGTPAGAIDDAMPAVLQAYVRATGRVAAAESAAIVRAIRLAPPDDRGVALDRALKALLPAGERGFALMRAALLRESLLAELADLELEPTADATMDLAVGMVDLVRSTAYLKRTGPAELSALVDSLFEASQSVTVGTGARVVKYVGDGVFLSSRDPEQLAGVVLELVDLLQESLPLSARAGLSYGPVVLRAGDVFGLPVNTAQTLSKLARPESVVADAELVRRLPRGMRGHGRTVTAGHPSLGRIRIFGVQRDQAG